MTIVPYTLRVSPRRKPSPADIGHGPAFEALPSRCWEWRGRVSKRGRPRARAGRVAEESPARVHMEETYGITLGPLMLRRPACGSITCVSPWHQLIAAPGPLLRGLVCEPEARQALVWLIRQGEARRALQVALEPLETFGIHPDMVAKIAGQVEVEPLAVLACFSRMVRTRSKYGT